MNTPDFPISRAAVVEILTKALSNHGEHGVCSGTLRDCISQVQNLTQDDILVDRIRAALGTDEQGENLVAVARDAHRAELELAKLSRENNGLKVGDTYSPDRPIRRVPGIPTYPLPQDPQEMVGGKMTIKIPPGVIEKRCHNCRHVSQAFVSLKACPLCKEPYQQTAPKGCTYHKAPAGCPGPSADCVCPMTGQQHCPGE